MRSPNPPPSPNPYDVANAQTQTNQDAALYNAQLNRFNTYTPLGSQEFSVTGSDPTTGAPIYRQDINLTPEMQQLLSQQNRQDLQLGNVAEGMLGRVGESYGRPLDTASLPGLRGQINSSGLPQLDTNMDRVRQGAQDALYARNTEYLDPQYQRGEESLRTRLANQGVVEGSEAYRNAFDDFNRSRETAYRQARNESIAGAGSEAQRLFGMQSSARGQLFGEQLAGSGFSNAARAQGMDELFAQRNLPLNEFNALRSASQVQMPSFQGAAQVGANPADLAGNIYNSYGGQMGIYNANMASRNALLSGLFGLGSSAIMASDERVKENIEKIGELSSGDNLYAFNYIGDKTPQVGVMAQEIESKDPGAIHVRNGVKHVDYARVLARALGG